jgi:hypothetical protein
MNRIVLVLIATAMLPTAPPIRVVAAGSSTAASGFECWSPIYGCLNFYNHDMCATEGFDWRNYGHCGICLYCEGEIGVCHPSCYPEDEIESVQLAYQSIVEAASRGDRQAVLDLAEDAPGYVFLNRFRWAVQVLDCERRGVIASLPLANAMSITFGQPGLGLSHSAESQVMEWLEVTLR